jgi:hypothetical protein
MPRFFISYSRNDGTDVAQRLASDIHSLSIYNKVFLDHESIGVGSDFKSEIEERIKNCDYFIVLLSAASLSSVWVKKEIDYVREAEKQTGIKKLFVVKYPTIKYPSFIPSNIQFLELSSNWAVDFYKLMRGINLNNSFYSIKHSIKANDDYNDVRLRLYYSDIFFKKFVQSVEYRFDHEFDQKELGGEKVVLKKNKKNDFQIKFWTPTSVTIFVVVYLNNSKKVNFIHEVEVG